MAVIVQPMLLADAYGVASSIDPMTGEQVVVAEVGVSPSAVTSGKAVAARYYLYPDLTVDPIPDHGALVPVGALRAVARLARTIRDQQRQEVEFEFGCRGNEIVVLQARPIAAPPPASMPEPPLPPGSWILDSVHYPRPLTPLFESIFAPMVGKVSAQVFAEYGVLARSIELRSINGWPYVRVVPLTNIAVPSLPGAVIGVVSRLHPRTRPRMKASLIALRSGLPATHVLRWQEVVRPSALGYVAEVADLDLRTCSGATVRELLATALQQLESILVSNYQTDFAHLIPLARFARSMRERRGWTDADALALVRSRAQAHAHYPAALEHLASRMRRIPAVKERLRYGAGYTVAAIVGDDIAARAAWDSHLRRWGLTLLGYDLDEPTVRELPELERRALVAILDGAGGRRIAPSDVPDDLTSAQRELLHDAQAWFHVREEGESVKAAVLGAIRMLALELGRRLVAAGMLPRADLAFYFTVQELTAASKEPSTVEDIDVLARENRRRVACGRTAAPELGKAAIRDPDLRWLPPASREVHEAVSILAQNEILFSVAGETETLRGRGASAGIHTGKVRIVSDPTQLSEVETGDVIVAPTVSSTWSTVFWLAGALVTEAGGLLSHSAIVAREMGIPAVVGVPGATTRLTTGEPVTVDGGKGTIARRMEA
jgi:rifampicin phosphotransferase